MDNCALNMEIQAIMPVFNKKQGKYQDENTNLF